MKKYAIVVINEEHIAMELNSVGNIKVIKVINATSEKHALYIFNTKPERSSLVGKVIIGGVVILCSLVGYGVVGGAIDCSNRLPTFAGAIKYHSMNIISGEAYKTFSNSKICSELRNKL